MLSSLKGGFMHQFVVNSKLEEAGCRRLLPRSGCGDGRPLSDSSSSTFMLWA